MSDDIKPVSPSSSAMAPKASPEQPRQQQHKTVLPKHKKKQQPASQHDAKTSLFDEFV